MTERCRPGRPLVARCRSTESIRRASADVISAQWAIAGWAGPNASESPLSMKKSLRKRGGDNTLRETCASGDGRTEEL